MTEVPGGDLIINVPEACTRTLRNVVEGNLLAFLDQPKMMKKEMAYHSSSPSNLERVIIIARFVKRIYAPEKRAGMQETRTAMNARINLYNKIAMMCIMSQINFRVDENDKLVLQALAKKKGVSIAEVAKQAVLNEIKALRVDLAFDLLKKGKIGRKKTFLISGLEYHEFLVEWTKRGAEEIIPDEAMQKGIDLALSIDLSKFLKEPMHDEK